MGERSIKQKDLCVDEQRVASRVWSFRSWIVHLVHVSAA